jgi:hypothetical protein
LFFIGLLLSGDWLSQNVISTVSFSLVPFPMRNVVRLAKRHDAASAAFPDAELAS